jgi:hypothetical protein
MAIFYLKRPAVVNEDEPRSSERLDHHLSTLNRGIDSAGEPDLLYIAGRGELVRIALIHALPQNIESPPEERPYRRASRIL